MLRRASILLAASFAASTFPGLAGQPFPLSEPAAERVVDYEKYGEFKGVGTFDYQYATKDFAGLSKASGEGIDPNRSVWRDPEYKRLKAAGQLVGSKWKFVDSGDPKKDFYVWATSAEDPGVRLIFTGRALEDAGMFDHALRAYRAAMILYPRSYCWSSERNFTWMVAPVAWSSIINLTRRHPELELRLADALVKTHAYVGGDPTKNDAAITPGKFVKFTAADAEKAKVPLARLKVVERRGGKVACVKYDNGHWGLQVDGKPFLVKGMTYSPTKIGFHVKDWDWMAADENHNGRNDPGFDAFVDANGNGVQDPNEPAVGDFKLLHDMGCNVIRLSVIHPIRLDVFREMFEKYGIRVILNEPLGAYTLHSGAKWEDGTDYRDPTQRKSMLEATRKLVEQCKGEPWLLAYVLGNENNMPTAGSGVNATRTNASVYPDAYADCLNEAATLIHQLDPDHPVGVGNLGLNLVDLYAEKAPALDFIGVNEYAGMQGFGWIWEASREIFDRPVLITEFGCDAYWTGKGPDEQTQATYIDNAWSDIVYNVAGQPGTGNAIGGLVFEWVDEWWKDGTKKERDGQHDSDPTVEMAFPDGWSQEEWLGITSQGDGKASPFLRELRKAYFALQKRWNEPMPGQMPGQIPAH